MRGDIYALRNNQNARGHEQKGTRYAIVVQSDALFSSTVIAVPTSTGAHPARHRPEVIVNGKRTRVLVEQAQAVDPERRFGSHVGHVSTDEMADVEQALRFVLGLF